MTNTIAIGYYSHASEVPMPGDLMEAYDTLEHIIRQIGLEPAWFGADDGKSRPQWKSLGASLHKKVLEAGGQGYRSVSLCVAAADGRELGCDKAAEATFAFAPESGDTLVEIAIQEPLLVLGSSTEMVIAKLASLWRWDYGFGLQRDSDKMPITYLGAGISRTEMAEEQRRIVVCCLPARGPSCAGSRHLPL